MKVVVTGAAGNIAYAILFMIGRGELLGRDQPIELRLLDMYDAHARMRAPPCSAFTRACGMNSGT